MTLSLLRTTILIVVVLPLTLIANIGQNVKAQINNNDAVSILGQIAYSDSTGFVHILGEVVNTSNQTIRSIQIIASIYDSSHRIIGTASGYADMDTLDPREASGFELISKKK